jgi:hypothetical protein
MPQQGEGQNVEVLQQMVGGMQDAWTCLSAWVQNNDGVAMVVLTLVIAGANLVSALAAKRSAQNAHEVWEATQDVEKRHVIKEVLMLQRRVYNKCGVVLGLYVDFEAKVNRYTEMFSLPPEAISGVLGLCKGSSQYQDYRKAYEEQIANEDEGVLRGMSTDALYEKLNYHLANEITAQAEIDKVQAATSFLDTHFLPLYLQRWTEAAKGN